MKKPGPHIESAIDNARVPKPDKRGLMPLAEARALVRTTDVYRKGEGVMIKGTFVLESDRVWAALLSLEDAAEFVREATRIHWAFHVRGFDNLGLVERYGDGILPWLRTRIDKNGVLHNIPWCVVPCLIALDSREALEVALSARGVDTQEWKFQGPGMFAADRHDDAEPGEPSADTLVVARKWIDAHPDRYDWVNELANGGSQQAGALLQDRAAVLGNVPEAARAILDAAETIDEPKGPAWNIGELDQAAEEYSLPLWDNANYTTGAMRITGLASRHGDVLIVQSIDYQPRASQPVVREIHAYGPGAKKRSLARTLVEDEGIELGENARVTGATNDIVVWGEFDEKGKPIEDSSGDRIIPSPMPFDSSAASLDGEDVAYDPHLPPVEGDPDDLHLVTPEEAMLFDLCRRHPHKVFLDDKGLAKLAPKAAIKLFQFDAFEWVPAGVRASTSIDIVTMVEALKSRKRIERLPGKANSHPEAWMLECARPRRYAGGNAWAPGDEPIARPRPTAGVGKTPYQNLLFEHGWPHGVTIFHGPPTTDGVEESFTDLLANGAATPPYFDRAKGTAWVRALGTAAKLTLKDKAVRSAMKETRPVHPGEARVLLRNLVNLPPWAAAQMVLILEALIGGDETILALADVLKGDSPALAAAAFESGFVLRRIPEKPHRIKGDPQRAKIRDRKQVRAVLAKAKPKGETLRMLRVALGEEDLLAAREDGPFDAFLVTLGGDAYLKKVSPRMTKEANAWAVYQLSVLNSPVAADILRGLNKMRKDLAESLAGVGIQ